MGCGSSKEEGGRTAEALSWDGMVKNPKTWELERAVQTEHLQRMRAEFWETRVEGREEMWVALMAAAEADSDELRFQIVDAAGIQPALRRKTLELVYDERGAIYEVPIYCLSAPANVDGEDACEEMKDARFYLQGYYESHRPKLVGHRM
mmetsp:Transcript_21540/g.31294  ORF Transcript_21540/g.31294 Transcript_21540/m.31294 type:complete len:149 (-) Transcript_21540:56-502(-)